MHYQIFSFGKLQYLSAGFPFKQLKETILDLFLFKL